MLIARVPVGTLLIDGILEQLRDAHWVAHTTRDAWVTTRDLGEVTLFDLMKALGIGLRGSVEGLGGLVLPWQARTARLLEQAEARQGDLLNVPIKSLLLADDPPVGEGTPAAPAASPALPIRAVKT